MVMLLYLMVHSYGVPDSLVSIAIQPIRNGLVFCSLYFG
jgi:hypothetical protein